MKYDGLRPETYRALEKCLQNGKEDFLPEAMKAHKEGQPVFQSRFGQEASYRLMEVMSRCGEGMYDLE